jgi:formamidopyrimidine-DNA glycosylase
MTGQFTVNPATDALPDHTHVVFDLANGTQLRFRDTRRFGSVELFPDAASVAAFLDARLGPEPDATDPDVFRTAVRGTSRTLKAILLDQSVVAGVGNIYADEALHRAGLHPERRGKSLSAAEIERLRGFVATVIAHAIEHRGSTIRDYIGGSGLRGQFQDEFRAYGRAGEPCLTCGTPMELVRVAGRASHFCPACQPAVTSPGPVSAAPSPRRRPRPA